MSNTSGLLVVLLASTCLSSAAVAGTLTVRQDGAGDYLTVAAAIAASVSGDTIEVGPGVYFEPPLTMTHSLRLVSTDGPDTTVFDGQNVQRILAASGQSNSSEVLGFQFRNGNSPGIGALSIVNDATATVRECTFTGNEWSAIAVHSGGTAIVEECTFDSNVSVGTPPGAIYASGSGSQLFLSDCELKSNGTPANGGAVSVVLGAYASIVRCRFEGNTAANHGAAVHVASFSSAEIEDSVFADNIGVESSAVYIVDSTGMVTNNTFYRNKCQNYQRGSVVLHVSSTVEVWNSIFYGELNGPGISYIGASGVHECNLFWGNMTGPIYGDAVNPSESEQDPIFCDAASGDFAVSTYGPAAPANSSCGALVGALAPACEATSVSVPSNPGASVCLGKNVPNPFNPITTIWYTTDAGGYVAITIFDVAGRRVRNLVAEDVPPGRREVRWDGRDDAGRRVGSGLYLYRMNAPGHVETKRMLLLK